MGTTLDIILEIFSWVGFGAAFLLLIAVVCVWVIDGTWLAADAVVDRDDDGAPVVRWIDADGEVNSARPVGDEAAVLDGQDAAAIWYRFGWNDRMRLTRRPPALRALLWGAAGALALGAVSAVGSVVLLFTR